MRNTLFALATLLLPVAAHAADAPEPPMPAPIVFFDIAGPDAAKLESFYAANFNWHIDSAHMVSTPTLNGTVRQDPPEKILYIGVPSIDDAIKKVVATGGKIVSPRIAIPTGTFVLFTDPAGNRMGLVETKKP